MKKRILGRTHVEVTPIILGTWAIGGWMWGGTNQSDAIAAIQASIEQGVNTIDTAAIYGAGLSEKLVGQAIRGKREQVVIATKCGMRWNSNEGAEPVASVDDQGNPITIRKNSKPDSIFYECEESLKRLGTDYIDLYQIHWPDSTTPIEESWAAMVKLKQQGKVRAIGVSNYNLSQLKIAHAIHPVASIQSPYSLIRREIEKEIIPFCIQEGISVIVYSPLERGLLTGKVDAKYTFAKGDHRSKNPTFSLENRKRVGVALEKLRPIGERHAATLAQLIIACTISRPGITAALVGARRPSQAIENAGAGKLQLTDQELSQITEAFHIPNIS
ncbi:MAG: aldo/keto reductase [Verrucomicrobia bacterium]|nr:aldo/keto reductase [Verrucomicrobiota bacterium]